MHLSQIQNRIFDIRGQKVMLDMDLAALYGVPTKALKQSVKRNPERFPQDFMFELTKEEFENLRSHIVTSKRGGSRYMPYAFTEQGVAMLSSVLNSDRAIQVNIHIIRTFVLIRQLAMSYSELAEKLKQLEKRYHQKFDQIFKALEYLLQEKQKESEFKNRNRIGFKR